MPTWGELLGEISSDWTDAAGNIDIDGLRRKYLRQLHELTGRNVVVYQTNWMTSGGGQDTSINLADIQGLMEVFKDLKPELGLDLILHSPGGDPTAADSLMSYMRDKFDDVRVIVPVAAMSAATMWALSADEIVLGRHSQLGPVDPQLVMNGASIPAGAITRTFERAQAECSFDPSRLSGWVPTLQQYFPGLLEICDDATRLSKELVEQYLTKYMFADKFDGDVLAREAAEFFGDDQIHIAHARRIGRDQLATLQLQIVNLEDDPALQDAVLSVHHAYTHSFTISTAAKIIENHIERLWVIHRPQQIAMPFAPS